MKKSAMVMVFMVIMMVVTMPVAARSWVEGHEAHIEDGDLYVDGKAVASVLIPRGDVNAIPVIVVDSNSRISNVFASFDSMMAFAVAVSNNGGYAIAVDPFIRQAQLGEYDPKEEYFGFMVTDVWMF